VGGMKKLLVPVVQTLLVLFVVVVASVGATMLLGGCSVVEKAKKLLNRVELCVERDGVKVCGKIDEDGDGKFDIHFVKDSEHEHLDRNP